MPRRQTITCGAQCSIMQLGFYPNIINTYTFILKWYCHVYIFMFYCCGPCPPKAMRGVEAQATCPTLETHAPDQHTSSTLIGGKGASGPSSRHTELEGPQEYVKLCKMDVKSTWIPTWHRMDHVSWSLGLLSKTTSWR